MNNPLKYSDPSGYFFKSVFRAVKRAVSSVVKRVKRVVKSTVKRVKKVLQKIQENKILGTVATIAAAYFTGGDALNYFGSHVAAGAAGGFAAGFVGSGGDLKAALIGGVTGAAAGYIGASSTFGKVGSITTKRVLAHGVVGGVSSVAQGGKFGSGFLSSTFTKSVSGFVQGGAEYIVGASNAASDLLGAAGAALVGGTASVLGGGKFSNGAQTAAIQYLFNQVASSRRGCSGQMCRARNNTKSNSPGIVERFLIKHGYGNLSLRGGFIVAGALDVIVTAEGVSVYFGVGLGAGLSATAAVGAYAGPDSSGLNIKTSASGGFGIGGNASLRVSEQGLTPSAGVGTGLGASLVTTIGYKTKVKDF